MKFRVKFGNSKNIEFYFLSDLHDLSPQKIEKVYFGLSLSSAVTYDSDYSQILIDKREIWTNSMVIMEHY